MDIIVDDLTHSTTEEEDAAMDVTGQGREYLMEYIEGRLRTIVIEAAEKVKADAMAIIMAQDPATIASIASQLTPIKPGPIKPGPIKAQGKQGE